MTEMNNGPVSESRREAKAATGSPFDLLSAPLEWVKERVKRAADAEMGPRSCELEELRDKEHGYLGETVQLCNAKPTEKSRISNYQDNIRAVYINGLNATTEEVVREGQMAADTLGRNTKVVINGQSSVVVMEQLSALVGLLSADLGGVVEHGATKNIQASVKEALDDGKKVKIFCFSQGSIITSNALECLKRQCSEEEWERISAATEVIAVGCPMQRWPTGISVLACAYDTDKAAKFGRMVSEAPSRVPLGGSGRVTSVIIPATKRSLSHTPSEYMAEISRFICASFKDPDGNTDGKGLAEHFVQSVLQGGWADRVHDGIVGEMVKERNSEFARIVTGNFPDGRIHQYIIPSIGTLEVLAS